MNLHVHDVDEGLMRRMKERAAGEGKSLKGWVVGVVEEALNGGASVPRSSKQDIQISETSQGSRAGGDRGFIGYVRPSTAREIDPDGNWGIASSSLGEEDRVDIGGKVEKLRGRRDL